jgi:hypothetical protein
VPYGGVCPISVSREDDCGASFVFLFCFVSFSQLLVFTHFAGRGTVPFESKSHQSLQTQKAALLPQLL